MRNSIITPNVLIILGGLGHEGISNSVLTYLEKMNKDGIKLSLGVAGKAENDVLARAKQIGIPIKLLPGRNTEPFKYFNALIKLVRTEKYDIVHVHGNSATLGIDMLAAKIGGCPVRIAHSRNTSCTHPKMDRCTRWLFNATYTDGFACGQAAGEWLFGSKPFTIIPNGKDIDRFSFNPQSRIELRKLYRTENKIVIGHVGAFNDQKNHDFLIDIFKRLQKKNNKYVLWLIGDDYGTKEQTVNKVKKLGLEDKVEYIGFRKDIERYLSAMDIMVFPSLYEGLPNVVIEWQIAGLPCFLSDTITHECQVMDNVKYLSLGAGADKWADKIDEVAIEDRTSTQEEIKHKMAEAGFDINENAKRLKKKYFELTRNEHR